MVNMSRIDRLVKKMPGGAVNPAVSDPVAYTENVQRLINYTSQAKSTKIDKKRYRSVGKAPRIKVNEKLNTKYPLCYTPTSQAEQSDQTATT